MTGERALNRLESIAEASQEGSIGMGLFAPRSFVGLDFGSHRLKAAEVVRSNGGCRVTRIGIIDTPPGAVSKGAAANAEALTPAIRSLLSEAGIHSKRVVTALGGQAVIIRELTLPEMPEGDLTQAVSFEAERFLPVGVGEVRCQYRILKRVPEERQLKILLVATGGELIHRHLAPLALAGLATAVMEVAPFSVVRAVVPRGNQSEAATMYADIGAESTDILVLDTEWVRLARNIPIGGNALTRAIADAFNLDSATAQTLKEQRAKMLVTGDRLDDPTLERLHRAILPVITSIATELRRSLDFYLGRLGGEAISKIILTGGTAKLKGLAPFLSEEVGVPVEIGNPFGTCEADASLSREYLADVAPTMAVAVGLALRGAQE